MTTNDLSESRWPHRVAILAALAALLPVTLGALTTTQGAGMAFPDWPTSDGHGMLEYPWLSSVGDKFLEHGHRLAGVLIGATALLLALVLWGLESRAWVRKLGWGLLTAVVLQGVLGGIRVRYNSTWLAFVHGSTAPLVYCLTWLIACVTSRGWLTARVPVAEQAPGRGLKWLAIGTWLLVYSQYVLGGLVRHHGLAVREHLIFAVLAALGCILLAVAAASTGHRWLSTPALLVGGLVLCQLVLGAGTWITKYGWDDRVAVYGSTQQVWFRTGHVLGGMLLFAGVSLLNFRLLRLKSLPVAIREEPEGIAVAERLTPTTELPVTPRAPRPLVGVGGGA